MNFIPPFLVEEPEAIKQLIAALGAHAMASVVTVHDNQPLSSFLPVDFMAADGLAIGTVVLHLANTNMQWESFKNGGWVLVEFKSPDMYISPSWFVDRNRAPTNVHSVVQCYGHARIIEDVEQKSRLLNAQVAAREGSAPNHWHPDELQNDGYARRLKAITLVEIPIESAKASVRMLQDESIANVHAVLMHLEASPATKEGWIATAIKNANADRL